MEKHSEELQKAWLDYQKKLLRFVKSKINSIEDAEDILSNVFTRLVLLDHNKIPKNLSAWLFHVAKNQIIDYYRTKKNMDELPDDLHFKENEVDAIQQLSTCMIPMINNLPEEYQQVLLLSEIEGLKYRQVAEQLNISLSAVKSRVLRGREKLHKSLLSCCSINKNTKGQVVSFNNKMQSNCSDC